ncbi:hypothetical protein ACQ4LE_000613 [Meloidogyne hapla]
MFCRLVAVFFAFLCLQQCCETMLRRPEKRQKVATNVDKLIDLTKKLKEDIKDLIGKGHNDFGIDLNLQLESIEMLEGFSAADKIIQFADLLQGFMEGQKSLDLPR